MILFGACSLNDVRARSDNSGRDGEINKKNVSEITFIRYALYRKIGKPNDLMF